MVPHNFLLLVSHAHALSVRKLPSAPYYFYIYFSSFFVCGAGKVNVRSLVPFQTLMRCAALRLLMCLTVIFCNTFEYLSTCPTIRHSFLCSSATEVLLLSRSSMDASIRSFCFIVPEKGSYLERGNGVWPLPHLPLPLRG